MSNDSDDKSLIKITDLFGTAKPLEQLVSAIERGIGNFMRPFQKNRETKADISAFKKWSEALSATGLTPRIAELSLGDRATVRLTADGLRQQQNRELIAAQAVQEYLQSPSDDSQEANANNSIEVEWLDRFWRLAQDVTDGDMQTVWARVLARQAQEPTRYSARCLEALSLLSKQEALKLEKLSGFVSSGTTEGAPSHFILLNPYRFGTVSPRQEVTERIKKLIGDLYKPTFGPAGFYTDSGSGWAKDISIDVAKGNAFIIIAGTRFVIRYPDATTCVDRLGSGLEISPLGAEIFSLIKSEPDPQYVEDISFCLSRYGLKLERCNG